MCSLNRMAQKKVMRRIIIIPALLLMVAIIVLALYAGIAFLFLSLKLDGQNPYYETNDIANYGIITHTHNNPKVESYFQGFFPESIEDHYENIEYSYHASLFDAVACEIYLEFTIDNEDAFNEHIEKTMDGQTPTVFSYDSSFQEYVLWDAIYVRPSVTDPLSQKCYIEYGIIQKMLFDPDEHRIIYVLLIVSDGGGTTTEVLGTYFNRFSIDPIKYEPSTENAIKQ